MKPQHNFSAGPDPSGISRRAALRGAGTLLALPWLESLLPTQALADTAGVATSQQPPLRTAFFFVPNGIHMPAWKPTQEGTNYELPPILQPLAPFKEKLLVLTNLALDGGRAHGDGAGDHARSGASFLTTAHPVKTAGAGIRNGISVDQWMAKELGYRTRFPSLELGLEQGSLSGNCDSGYSCAYSSNISWRTPTTPVPKEINPRLVFERLVASQNTQESEETRARRKVYQQSILDFVMEDAKRIKKRLGQTDRQKMEEYLYSVREVEQRLDRFFSTKPIHHPEPEGTGADCTEHFKLLSDMLWLAFQSDSTRIATFMVANEGSNRAYREAGVNDAHHGLSHHQKNPDKLAKIQKINTYHLELFAHFIKRLADTKEGNGTLLDNTVVLYGSGLSDGDRHNHDDLPVIVVGNGQGRLQTGQHVVYNPDTPMANLFLTMLRLTGVQAESFGDSTGILPIAKDLS